MQRHFLEDSSWNVYNITAHVADNSHPIHLNFHANMVGKHCCIVDC